MSQVGIVELQNLVDDPQFELEVSAEKDGIFDRIKQILVAKQKHGDLIGSSDLAVLIRHALRRLQLRSHDLGLLRVPIGPGWPRKEKWQSHGFRIHKETSETCLIEATPWMPAWLEEHDKPVFEDAYSEKEVRRNWTRPMDPFLQSSAGFVCYLSPGQREAVRSALLMPRGETLIVNLPTGSGKSLVAQAPVLTKGLEAGLTICIVPTISLSLDQARQMEGRMKANYSHLNLPQFAWHSGLPEADKRDIKSAIREGRQGIIYCSPEAATGALLPALYYAARKGLISYLVIDEAHLVTEWGDVFRPAFQMLSGVKRGLQAACPPGQEFRTILMSATMAPDTVKTIEALFGPREKTQFVASVNLRPEPQYWIHREDDPLEKEKKVLEVLRFAPRPFILYLTKPDEARHWLEILHRNGYERVDCFHGKTGSGKRLEIINKWDADLLDGIVATSAFGVGIDKQNVRTILHATVPETLDRLYQEVGRGGRDGKPSVSFVIFSEEDFQQARDLSAPDAISDELGFGRWLAMKAGAKRLDGTGEVLAINLKVTPPWIRQESDFNTAWNMRTLIMMARAGMLTLEPSEPPQSQNGDEPSDDDWDEFYSRAVVKVDLDLVRDVESFEKHLLDERSRASRSAARNMRLLGDFLSTKKEISQLFKSLYTSHASERVVVVTPSCGGCPEHRRSQSNSLNYSMPSSSGIFRVSQQDLGPFAARFPHLDTSNPIIVPLPGRFRDSTVIEAARTLINLAGLKEIAMPDVFRRINNQAVSDLHKYASDRVLIIQSTDEEMEHAPAAYEVPRATIWLHSGVDKFPDYLWPLKRPLHLIFAPDHTEDPFHPSRRLEDTGSNILRLEQFGLGEQS